MLSAENYCKTVFPLVQLVENTQDVLCIYICFAHHSLLPSSYKRKRREEKMIKELEKKKKLEELKSKSEVESTTKDTGKD